MLNDYTLNFDLSSYNKLDAFALLADQKYNLGDKDDWFNQFRSSLHGLYSRLTGVQIHFKKVHSWDFVIKTPNIIDYHLSSIFFNMDSAIECMVFALNAFGYVVDSSNFRDITDEKELRKISPNDLLGNPKTAVKGYNVYFPLLKEHLLNNRDFLSIIFEQHDVSKHRSAIYHGGKIRDDPPSGFFERLGIAGDKIKQIPFHPMAEILVMPQLKTPLKQRKHQDRKDIVNLEEIAERFCTFINACGNKALADAKSNVKLTYYEFQH
jgi:hypothetical protein